MLLVLGVGVAEWAWFESGAETLGRGVGIAVGTGDGATVGRDVGAGTMGNAEGLGTKAETEEVGRSDADVELESKASLFTRPASSWQDARNGNINNTGRNGRFLGMLITMFLFH